MESIIEKVSWRDKLNEVVLKASTHDVRVTLIQISKVRYDELILEFNNSESVTLGSGFTNSTILEWHEEIPDNLIYMQLSNGEKVMGHWEEGGHRLGLKAWRENPQSAVEALVSAELPSLDEMLDFYKSRRKARKDA